MSGGGGGGGTISTSEPRLGAMRIQQSSYGLALPIVYGRTRVAGNLIWYGNFVAIAHTTTTTSGGGGGKGGGGGGGGVTQQTTTYTYEAALMMALCEGPIGGVTAVWQGKKRFDNIAQLNLSQALGTAGQPTWGHLSSNHPAQALGYSSTAHLHSAAFSLGSNAEIDNHSFELDGKLQFGGGIVDANPKDIVHDLLTNAQYGAAFPSGSMGDLTVYGSYCQAMGLFLSPAFTEQQEAREHLKLLTSMTNSACVWSEGKLKLVPYGDEAVSGNGATYTPNLTPIYDLTDDDYIVTGAEDPVKCDRKTPADAFNQVQVEYLNRANAYNIEIAEAKDQANIEKFGLRPRDPIKMHAICDAAVARRAAQLQLQRSLYVRNEYEFRLGWKYCLLEPMDLVTLTDEGLGLDRTPVRIIEVQEDADGLLTLRAEDYPFGVASATLYPTQSGAGFAADYNAAPGNVATPVFFEPPIELATATGLEVWCAVSGLAGSAGSLWGGCHVWASLDGSTYKQVGTVTGGARYGELTAALASGSGGTAAVSLAGRGGQMLSGTAQDAAQLSTLCWVGNAAGGDFFAYETATLSSANAYSLSGLVRGAYRSSLSGQPVGAKFVRVDAAVVKSDPLDPSMIGQTLYFKFCSFNVYGGGGQGLADVSAHAYTIAGNMLQLPPSNVTGLGIALQGNGVRLTWDACPDVDWTSSIIRVGPNWAGSVEVANKRATSHLLGWVTSGPLTVWAVHVDRFGNPSTTPASTTLTVLSPSFPRQLSLILGTASIEAAWEAPAVAANQQPLDRVELSWSPAFTTVIDAKKATTATFGWMAAGVYTLYARYVDVAGNIGESSQVDLQISPPNQPTMTAVEAQINAVTLRWQDAKTSQPIRKYAIWYADAGTSFGASLLYGSAGADSRSDILFYRSSGDKVAWLVAEDVAGNQSAPRQIDVRITMPNNFVLATEYYADWQPLELTNGVIVNGPAGQVILPSYAGRTWGARLSDGGWATAQQKIDAGYPILIQRVPSSGKHAEWHDMGRLLSNGVIRVTPSLQSSVAGFTATVRVRVSQGESTTLWQDWLVGADVSMSNFRYIEVEYAVDSDGRGFVVLDDLAVRVEISEVTESATLALVAGDAGGTVYTCEKPFLDVKTVQATALASANISTINCIVDDTTLPAKVYVQAWDETHTRTGGTVSLLISGV